MGVAKVASGLGPHGLLAAAVIAGTVAVGTAVVKNWDKVKEAVGNAWSWIKEKASGLWDGMKSIGGNLMSGLPTRVKSAGSGPCLCHHQRIQAYPRHPLALEGHGRYR